MKQEKVPAAHILKTWVVVVLVSGLAAAVGYGALEDAGPDTVALLEAFAAGLPCIVSDRGGNEEVVSDGRNGVIVPPQNVGSLARALQSLAQDEPWRRRLATAALDTARVFDLSNTVGRTERLLLSAS